MEGNKRRKRTRERQPCVHDTHSFAIIGRTRTATFTEDLSAGADLLWSVILVLANNNREQNRDTCVLSLKNIFLSVSWHLGDCCFSLRESFLSSIFHACVRLLASSFNLRGAVLEAVAPDSESQN